MEGGISSHARATGHLLVPNYMGRALGVGRMLGVARFGRWHFRLAASHLAQGLGLAKFVRADSANVSISSE